MSFLFITVSLPTIGLLSLLRAFSINLISHSEHAFFQYFFVLLPNPFVSHLANGLFFPQLL